MGIIAQKLVLVKNSGYEDGIFRRHCEEDVARRSNLPFHDILLSWMTGFACPWIAARSLIARNDDGGEC